MSLIQEIKNLISEGSEHYFDSFHGLTDYHAAEKVRNALRKRDAFVRYKAIAAALRHYHVAVHFDGESIRIFRADTQAELTFNRK